MSRATNLHPRDREIALKRLADGDTQVEIAKDLDIGVHVIKRLAQEEGFPRTLPATEQMNKRVDFNSANRLNALNIAFERGLTFLADEKLTPSQYQCVVTSIAILVDKRRLEEGEVTSRHETVSTDATRERLLAQLSRQTILPAQDTGESTQPN